MNMISKALRVLSLKVVRVRGSSMEPTLPDGALVLVDRRAFRGPRRPERFDLVRLEDPERRGHWIIKRVVGLPDEEVRLGGDRLYVNGQEVIETYERRPDEGHAAAAGVQEWWPAEDEYVVLGDNRSASTDSRKFGVVKIDMLRGKVGRRLR